MNSERDIWSWRKRLVKLLRSLLLFSTCFSETAELCCIRPRPELNWSSSGQFLKLRNQNIHFWSPTHPGFIPRFAVHLFRRDTRSCFSAGCLRDFIFHQLLKKTSQCIPLLIFSPMGWLLDWASYRFDPLREVGLLFFECLGFWTLLAAIGNGIVRLCWWKDRL